KKVQTMTQKRKLNLLLAVAALSAASSARATILWDPADAGQLPTLSSADLCGSISWYNDSQRGTCYRVQCVDTTTTDNRERAEFTHYIDEGTTAYIGWRSRLDLISSSEVRTLGQFKAHGSWTINYPFTIEASGNTYRLVTFDTSNTGTTIWSITLPSKSTWISMELKVNVSSDPSVGYIELWYNGTHQVFSNGSTRWNGATFSGSSCDFHWGIYRSTRVNGTENHYVLRPCIATTYSEAGPPSDPFAGTWEIQNVTSGKVLNSGGSTTLGSPVTQWSQGTSDNLKFIFIPNANGYYEIQNVASGLDVVVQGASTA